MQRRPRRRGVHRVIEKLLDPCRKQVFPSRDSMCCARARRYLGRARRRGPVGAHGDVARDRAAPGRRAVASKRRAPRPAAGDLTSANQKYGGPPWRSRDFAATLPSGAISENSPSSDFSAVKMTRKGAPFHGATGDGRTAISAASSQMPDDPWARESTAEQSSSNAVAAAAKLTRRNRKAPSGVYAANRNHGSGNFCEGVRCNHSKNPSPGEWTAAHLNCSNTNQFLSLSEHLSAWPDVYGGWAADGDRVHCPGPPQWPFCAAENFRSRRKFSFLAVTA